MYKNLRQQGYNFKQVCQLKYLENYDEDELNELLFKIDCEYSENHLSQIIKCITHNMEYELFLNKKLTVEKINEVRRFLEDTVGECKPKTKEQKQYYKLAEEMLYNNWEANLIYEFRTFFKCDKKILYEQAKWLFDFANKYPYWIILSGLNCIFKKYDFDKVIEFVKSLDIEKELKNLNSINGNIIIEIFEKAGGY